MWSYRPNNSDQVYASGAGGPAYVPYKPTLYDGSASQLAIDPAAGFVVLTKATAGAYTLAVPTEDGQALEITAGTAAAHVVTATGLLHNGITGGAKNAWTSAAFLGSSLKLRAWNGKWHVISLQTGAVA